MRAIAAAIAMALLLVACGGDDDTAAPTTTASTAASTSTTTVATTITTTTFLPVAPADAAGTARVIDETDGVIHDPAGDAASAGHAQQVAYRTLAAHPEWDDEVRAALPERLRASMDANVLAGRQLRALVKNPRPNLPAWRIVEPAPADELLAFYKEGEAQFGVPWQYLAAVHLTETKMGRIRGTSTAGAKGPMQFLPSTWDAYGGGGDIESNHDSIIAAARYLHANGAPERIDDALHHYNPTDKYVLAVKAYASVMIADEREYRGYYGWQVYYWSTLGDVWLKVGYDEPAERPVQPSDV